MKKNRKKTKRAVIRYAITTEQVDIGHAMPAELEKELHQLYQKVQNHPEETLKRLMELKETYPKQPQIYNMIGGVYNILGDHAKAEEVAIASYEATPDNLFSKINYANFILAEDRLEEIPAIFGEKLDLCALYPNREVFHTSEIVAFLGVIGPYLALTGDRPLARDCMSIIKRLDPNSAYLDRLATCFTSDPFNKRGHSCSTDHNEPHVHGPHCHH